MSSKDDPLHLKPQATPTDRAFGKLDSVPVIKSPLSNDVSKMVRDSTHLLLVGASAASEASAPERAASRELETRGSTASSSSDEPSVRKRRLSSKNPGPLTQLAILNLRNEQNCCGPLSAPPALTRPPLLPAAAPALETVDAAQALLGLMNGSPTTLTPATAPPFTHRTLELPRPSSPPSPALSAGADASKAKRRKRAVEMTPAELHHARETNKRSAQQFRERERLRRLELLAHSEQLHRVNEDLRKEVRALESMRRDLAARVRATPQLVQGLPPARVESERGTSPSTTATTTTTDPPLLAAAAVPLIASPAPPPAPVLAAAAAAASVTPTPSSGNPSTAGPVGSSVVVVPAPASSQSGSESC